LNYKHYTHIGNEAQEKAIQAISGGISEVTDRERIEKALQLINTISQKSGTMKKLQSILSSE